VHDEPVTIRNRDIQQSVDGEICMQVPSTAMVIRTVQQRKANDMNFVTVHQYIGQAYMQTAKAASRSSATCFDLATPMPTLTWEAAQFA
jgi:orotidine-5'-phosphate decarboxylase